MNIKQLEKAGKIITEIKTLDKEIIEIEKYAMIVADGETEINLSLKIKDLKKKEEEGNKVKFDEDGSIISADSIQRSIESMMRRTIYMSYDVGGSLKSNDDSISNYESAIHENAALQIFGILLYIKQTKRTELLSKLNKMGVNL